MKFRKKPVVIDAVHFADNGKSISALSDLAGTEIRVDYSDPACPVLKIETLEGTMLAMPGDWIIRGIEGELYPCKAAIFDKTYEPA